MNILATKIALNFSGSYSRVWLPKLTNHSVRTERNNRALQYKNFLILIVVISFLNVDQLLTETVRTDAYLDS